MSHEPPLSLSRRHALRRLGGACGAVGALGVMGFGPENILATTAAADCPELAGKRIRWLVGWSPGGGYDAYSRMLEPSLEERLDAQIVIENVPGSAGLVAARQLIRARPDGRTLAIVNATGLLISPWSNPEFAPDIHTDFTILGRIVRHHQLLVTGPESDIRSPEDLLRRRQEGRPLVLGETGPSTINFLLAAILEDLFGVQVDIVLGFPGSTEILTALRRGDLDGAVIGDESARLFPDLTPVLRFGEQSAAEDPWYSRAAKLTGDDGLVATQPGLFPGDSGRLREDVDALTSIMEVGRLVVGPAGMSGSMETCLGRAVLAALRGDAFRAAVARGNRTASPASGAEVRGHLDRSKELLPRFQATVERAARRVRG